VTFKKHFKGDARHKSLLSSALATDIQTYNISHSLTNSVAQEPEDSSPHSQ